MIDILIILMITLCILEATRYIYKQKKNGARCIGCSSAGSCQSKQCSSIDIKKAYYKDKDLS